MLLLLPLVAGNEAATAHTCMCVRAEVEEIQMPIPQRREKAKARVKARKEKEKGRHKAMARVPDVAANLGGLTRRATSCTSLTLGVHADPPAVSATTSPRFKLRPAMPLHLHLAATLLEVTKVVPRVVEAVKRA